MGKIPVATALLKMGVNIQSSFCGACVGGIENADHALISCAFSSRIWADILAWCGLDGTCYASVREALEDAIKLRSGSKRKLITLSSIFYGTLWCVWRARMIVCLMPIWLPLGR